MNRNELVQSYVRVIYDSYNAYVQEKKDYETFGHEMAIVLPMILKLLTDLSEQLDKLEGAKQGEFIKTTNNE